jgi:type I restriction enzyme S subunit
MSHKVPESWRTVTVGDIKAPTKGSIAIGPFGSRMKADTYTPTGIPVVRGQNIGDTSCLQGDFVYIPASLAEKMRSSMLKTGDLFFPHRGAIGEVGIIDAQATPPYMLSTSLMKLSPDPGVADARFLFYFFRSPQGRHQLLSNASQVGTPGIARPLTSLRSIELSLPPLREQVAIASVLASLDDKIDSNRRLTELMEETAATVFRARFVDFVGVQEFDDSDMGRIPRGWVARRFSEGVDINPRVALRKGDVAPFIEMAAVEPWALRPRTIGQRPYGGGARFEPNDTLMARITPCVEHGKGAFIDFLSTPASGSTEFIVLRAKPPLTPEVVFLLSRDERVRSHALANMTGSSGRQRVPIGCFDDLWIAVPPDRNCWEQDGELLRTALSTSRGLWLESRSLSAVRNALLPKLISGQLRVPNTDDPEEAIGPVAAQLAAGTP